MAYQIDKFDNTLLTTVEDGTLDQTTNLKFIGKNYAGYGEIQNENFLFLLENFAGGNAPSRAIRGQIWYDTTQNKLKYFVATDGAAPGVGYWKSTGGSSVAAAAPTGLSEGDFWWDTVNGQLYVLDANSNFVLVGPQVAGSGVTSMISDEVQDTAGNQKSIIKAVVNDDVVYVISQEQFTLSTQDQLDLSGYTVIYKGLTVKSLNGATGISSADVKYHGTATNAERLGGLAADQYLLKTSKSFTGQVTFDDSGLVVGTDSDLKVYIENGDKAVIENQTGSNSEIRIKTTNNAGTSIHTLTFNDSGLLPFTSNTIDLGASGSVFANVYATTFNGRATEANNLQTTTAANTTAYRNAHVLAQADTIAARDGAGNINANLFVGTATSARFADLAEKYTTDQEYPVGTAMAVCAHPDHEAHAACTTDMCIGVISAEPAYLMNSEADGQAIGLKGRVPVRVKGPVSKGMAVYAWQDGVCTTIASIGLVGIALETNHEEGEKLVECILKV